jgi:hypothetical protein
MTLADTKACAHARLVWSGVVRDMTPRRIGLKLKLKLATPPGDDYCLIPYRRAGQS